MLFGGDQARVFQQGFDQALGEEANHRRGHPVAHHLHQAFRKLTIASRYELARIVIEQAADDPAQ